MNLYCCRNHLKLEKVFANSMELICLEGMEKILLEESGFFSNSVPIDFPFNSKKVSQQLDIP